MKFVRFQDNFPSQVPKEQNNQLPLAIGICLFLIVLVWLVFGQTLRFDFVNYDDPLYVSKNPVIGSGVTLRGLQLAFTRGHAANWHPITTISHMLDCQFFGLNPAGPHLVNVVLHTVASLLLFLVLWQMTDGIWQSAFVAAVFAIHPLRVESVAWISERKDVLSGVFFMLVLCVYARYARRPTVNRYVVVVILFALGLMAKAMLMTLPLVLLLLDYWPFERLSWERRSITRAVVEKLPLLILGAASCIMTLIVQWPTMQGIKDLPLGLRMAHAPVSYLTYLWQMFSPTKLAVFYPYTSTGHWTPIIAIVFVLAISVNVLALRRTFPFLVTGWGWYIVMLLPVIGIFQVGLQSHADRYTYLPQIGLYLAIAWLVADVSKSWRYRRQLFGVGAVALVGVLTWRAHVQTEYWRDSGTLWRHALAVTQNNYLAHNNLAVFLRGGDEAALHLEQAIQLQPNYGDAHYHLGRLLFKKGEFDRAIDHLQRSVAAQPYVSDGWSALGDAFVVKGKASEAVHCYERALELTPESVNALTGLAWIFATCPDSSLRNGERATQLARSAVQLSRRRDPVVLRTLAASYAEVAQFDQAVASAREALTLAQTDSDLASKVRLELDLYETKLPLRDTAVAR